ncbi:hypothetical protein TNCV_4868281 [Trichonephila clavipes]|nr:hypothetical protein TNCV_4868281 [Trichonephila clavipes]
MVGWAKKITSDDHSIIRQAKRDRNQTAGSCIRKRDLWIGPECFVGGGTMDEWIHIFDRGSFAGERYCDNVIVSYKCLFQVET